jgi:hypothetical protein
MKIIKCEINDLEPLRVKVKTLISQGWKTIGGYSNQEYFFCILSK